MKKLSLYIFLVLMFSNFTTVLKAEKIEVFCLVKSQSLKFAKLDPKDYFRFQGEEIHLIIDFDEKVIINKSINSDLSIITGIIDRVEFQENSIDNDTTWIEYNNTVYIEEGEVKYKYDNHISIDNGKPKILSARVDQSGLSFNEWNFLIGCRDNEFSEEEKAFAGNKASKFLQWKKEHEERQKKKESDDNIYFGTKNITNIEDVLKIEDIKDKYLCMLKDVSNVEITEWTLSVTKTMGAFAQKYFVENSCCPEKGKKFSIYNHDLQKLKWFDLIEDELYFSTLERSDSKVKHKKFSIKLEATDYNKLNKLYTKAEISKKDHDAGLIGTNTYVNEEEKFFYTANVFFKENMKDNNNVLTLFDADCE